MKQRASALLILCFIPILTFKAQDSISVPKKKVSYLCDTRHWAIEIPIWIPGFRGEFAYGDVEIEGEDGTIPVPEHPIEKPQFGDAFTQLFKTRSSLNYFFVMSASYTHNKIYGELDLFSGSMKEDLKFRYSNKAIVGAKVHTDLSRLSIGYELFEEFLFSDNARYQMYAYTGARIHNFKVASSLDNLGRTLKIDPIWIEPILGLKNKIDLNYWQFIIQADMGSFGMDEILSYQINLFAFYRISNLISLKGGWNSWYVNYNNRYRNEDLLVKVHLAGPVAAVVFNF